MVEFDQTRIDRSSPMEKGRESPRGLLLGAWLLAVCGSAYLIAPAGILPVLTAELAIGAAAASWIVSVPYAAEAVVGLPAGRVLDRFDAGRVVTAAVVGLLVAIVWGWFAGGEGDYASFLASRFLGGMAFAALWIASIDLVGRSVDPRNEATALGFYTTSGPVGLALGLALAPVVASRVGWLATFPVQGCLLTLSFVAFALVGGTADPPSNDARSGPTVGALADVLGNRRVWSVAAMAFVAYSLLLLFSGWMPSYLATTSDLSLEEGGLLVALVPALGVLSRSGGGLVSDRLMERRRRPIARASFLVVAPATAALLAVNDAVLIVILLVLVGFFVQFGIGVFFSYARDLVPDAVGGTTVAFVSTVGILGSFTAPIVAGTLIEDTGAFDAVFGYAALLAVVGLAFAWIAPEPRDAG
ncbi:MFS transporter [Halomarina pelagica]|uniref:MFS transporter n=1 Tax=Halomarina pelagica TaxID=2961599 RepID=UPI0020C28A6C|nr:MFS transporter [Halomarina sp. BND7]